MVEEVYLVDPIREGGGGLQLVKEKITKHFERDYDKDGEDNPSAWSKQYNLNNWGIFAAMENGNTIGGAAVALDGPIFPVRNLQRGDLAILWDIRVHPDFKRQGIG